VYPKHESRAYSQYIIVPEIRLAGKWLMESGFEYGQNIKIEVENGKLVITKKEDEIS
jgi:toxic protein SymE